MVSSASCSSSSDCLKISLLLCCPKSYTVRVFSLAYFQGASPFLLTVPLACLPKEKLLKMFFCRVMRAPCPWSYAQTVSFLKSESFHNFLNVLVDADEIRRLGKRFRKLDLDNSGALSIDEFMSLPELQQNPLVQRVIDIFDADGNGEVDFKGWCGCTEQVGLNLDYLLFTWLLQIIG